MTGLDFKIVIILTGWQCIRSRDTGNVSGGSIHPAAGRLPNLL
jgi:hypothetical protein